MSPASGISESANPSYMNIPLPVSVSGSRRGSASIQGEMTGFGAANATDGTKIGPDELAQLLRQEDEEDQHPDRKGGDSITGDGRSDLNPTVVVLHNQADEEVISPNSQVKSLMVDGADENVVSSVVSVGSGSIQKVVLKIDPQVVEGEEVQQDESDLEMSPRHNEEEEEKKTFVVASHQKL